MGIEGVGHASVLEQPDAKTYRGVMRKDGSRRIHIQSPSHLAT